jgi:hypothetical protein
VSVTLTTRNKMAYSGNKKKNVKMNYKAYIFIWMQRMHISYHFNNCTTMARDINCHHT